jgi:hypothetical protein
MRRIIFALFLSFSTAAVLAQAAKPIELAPDAPDHHVVVPGDTLWGIAGKFLKDPLRWPDVWKMNAEQVKNPHRIYPGQVVILDRSGTDPQLKLGQVVKLEPQVRVEMNAKEIPALPPQAIEPFLAQPLVIDMRQFENAPRIVATQENRVFTGNGDTIYVSGADPKVGLWQIYRPGRAIVDPETQEALGVEAMYLGNARKISESGEITTLLITAVKAEIGRGDYLVPASRPDVMNYAPHEPAQPVTARVMMMHSGDREGGRNSIIMISRGKRDGLELGHVLSIHRAGTTVSNRFDDGKPQTHVLPDERYGRVFVFRVFDRVSYALVMEAAWPVMSGDRVSQP